MLVCGCREVWVKDILLICSECEGGFPVGNMFDKVTPRYFFFCVRTLINVVRFTAGQLKYKFINEVLLLVRWW